MEIEVRRHGGSDAKRLKALEDESHRLKKRLAEEVMDNATLKEMLTKKLLTPRSRKSAVSWAITEKRERLLATPYLPPDRTCAEGLPVSHAAK
jgi:putative transposase